MSGAIFRYRPELPPDYADRERVVPPDDLRDYLRRYVALTDVQYDAVTLWVCHSHTIDAADCTPYLHFTSDGPRSGKTRALEVLELVVANPWLTGRVTGPALVRKIDAERPTLLLDETDATFSGSRSSYEILRGVLNSGYRLNGRTSYAVGGSYKDLATYCPKALAGIGGLPSTIADRSITIKMERRELQQVQRFRAREAVNEARFVRARLARYAALNLEALARARPLIPSELDDRAADVWEPLLAIADTFGQGWASRARIAAVTLMNGRDRSPASALSLELLADVRAVFEALGDPDRVSTRQLVPLLQERSETWRDLNGRPLDHTDLAELLRVWQIRPIMIKFGKVPLKGYYRSYFVEAWRMLEPVVSSEPVLEAEPQEPLLEEPTCEDEGMVGT